MPGMKKRRLSRTSRTGLKGKPNRVSRGKKVSVTASVNFWGLAGRSEIMEARRLLQLRIPRPCK
jgi:hypothetical protein